MDGVRPQILYTDATEDINVATSNREVTRSHRIDETSRSHLQDLVFVDTREGPRIQALNIRATDAKMIQYDPSFTPKWAVELTYDAAMANTVLLGWDGDGNDEIAVGSLEAGADVCSLQIMETDGTPLYWHGR